MVQISKQGKTRDDEAWPILKMGGAMVCGRERAHRAVLPDPAWRGDARPLSLEGNSAYHEALTNSRPRHPLPLPSDAPGEHAAIPVEPRLGDQAYAALEELIVTAALPPGSLWSEATLSERTGIGRTPVREALQRLAVDHLVVLLRRHGIKITEVQVAEQLLVLDARRELERLVSVWAARRATKAEREAHMRNAIDLREAGAKRDPLLYLRVHFAMKRFTSECARNPYAARALSPLHSLSRRFFYVHHDRFGDLMEVARVHADLAEAIGHSDEAGASACCDAMTDYAVAFTRKIILE